MGYGRAKDLMSIFLRHRVAANLLMWFMIAAGAWGLLHLNKQFMPTFHVNLVTVKVIWPGATADDIERSIINPLEKELRNLDYLKEMKSKATQDVGSVSLEFEQGADMAKAIEDTRERVSLVRNLPPDIEETKITKDENFERVSSVIITGSQNLNELRPLIRKFEHQLLDRGIAKIDVIGLPDQEIAIKIPAERLAKLNISLTQVAKKIKAFSVDLPAGDIGGGKTTRQLRSLQQQRSITGFENLPLLSDSTGRIIRVKDVAEVELQSQKGEVILTYQGKPAVEMILRRTETSDSLKSAKILQQWQKEVIPTLPKGVNVHVFDEVWVLINQRIMLLLKNGLSGLILILIILFLFLDHRVAWWVSVGIPVSFMMTLGILSLLGGSINMVSMFAFIMSLGIIVDDTIVVGEEAVTLFQKGTPILEAVEMGAKRMFAPVMASSLTTISAFIPLFLIRGVIGTILTAIPTVVICVIIASLIECFLVLPGHLYHSMQKIQTHKAYPWRERIDNAFHHFRETRFRSFINTALSNRKIVMSVLVAILLLMTAIVMTGRLHFTFFPDPEGNIIEANIQFRAGTSDSDREKFVKKAEKTLWQVNKKLSKNSKSLVVAALAYVNKGAFRIGEGEEYGALKVQLTEPDSRKISNVNFIKAWSDAVSLPPEVASFTIRQRRAGPPGQDVEINLIGNNTQQLKLAALELARILKKYPGVSGVEDNLPYGQEQFIYSLTPAGEALGLTTTDVGRQLRAAFTGEIVQVYYLPDEEVEVRTMLPDNERDSLMTLDKLPIITPAGDFVQLMSVVKIDKHRGFDTLRHVDTKSHVTLEGRVDPSVGNSNKILTDILENYLPNIMKKYNVTYDIGGRTREQSETLSDMKYAGIIAVVLIYLILAWVFASYGWPLLVMAVIPFGIVGGLFGHLVMGHDVTILSLLGLFGLSGIIINDSIILLVRYKEVLKKGFEGKAAIVEASCQRLRAVLLTSLTTIAGLTPLLFETSRQAQFLIPMAISLCFGLAFGMFVILVLVPTFLSMYEEVLQKTVRKA